MSGIIAAEFAAQDVAVARHILERHAQQHLAHSAAIKGGGVDEVHAKVEGDVDSAHGFVDVDAAKFSSKGGCAEGEDSQFQASVSEFALDHQSILTPTVSRTLAKRC